MPNAYSGRPPLVPALVLSALGAALFGCAQPQANGTGTGGSTGAGGSSDPYAGYAAKALHVSGANIVDTTGATVRLLGVNRSGSEYMCVPPTVGGKTFDGSTGPNSITAMKSWHINVVRLPLNESCWVGMTGTLVPPDQYQSEVESYVQALHAQGLYVILDLHWSAPGTSLSTKQTTMAYAAHAPAFWTSVATRFKTDPMVIFDLYNEPVLDAAYAGDAAVGDATAAWNCWLNGCTVSSGALAGMQQLLNAVRATGANQIIIAGGVDWAHKLDQWIAHKPADGQGNVVAGLHIYSDGACITQSSCWDSIVAPVALAVPVITGELGERDCQASFINGYMPWADSKGISYLGWAWNPQDCSTFPSLISNIDGTPTTFGQGLHDHLLQLNP